jgi:hypothetical protein
MKTYTLLLIDLLLLLSPLLYLNGGRTSDDRESLSTSNELEAVIACMSITGTHEQTGSVVYKNAQYGSTFALPASWNGYKVLNEKWEGLSLEEDHQGEVPETGPIVIIRHPEWTSAKPRQDIPVMVFTTDQWNSLQQEKFHIGAAPIDPSELGRNASYVFALPARYNFAFLTGYEEVEDILKSNSLKPIEVNGAPNQ